MPLPMHPWLIANVCLHTAQPFLPVPSLAPFPSDSVLAALVHGPLCRRHLNTTEHHDSAWGSTLWCPAATPAPASPPSGQLHVDLSHYELWSHRSLTPTCSTTHSTFRWWNTTEHHWNTLGDVCSAGSVPVNTALQHLPFPKWNGTYFMKHTWSHYWCQ